MVRNVFYVKPEATRPEELGVGGRRMQGDRQHPESLGVGQPSTKTPLPPLCSLGSQLTPSPTSSFPRGHLQAPSGYPRAGGMKSLIL